MIFQDRFHVINYKYKVIKEKQEKIVSLLREIADDIRDVDRLYKEELSK